MTKRPNHCVERAGVSLRARSSSRDRFPLFSVAHAGVGRHTHAQVTYENKHYNYMRIFWFIAVAFPVLTLCSGVVGAPIVAYDTTAGGLYNAVGPVEASPSFIGDRFAVSTSGWLETIALPLDNSFTFAGPVANGTVTLWSDQEGSVGTSLFSASVSATFFPNSSNEDLPPFTQILVTTQNSVFLDTGAFYWVTLSQTAGSGGLVFYSNVNLASLATVYFGDSPVPQYAQGRQPMVAQIGVTPVPEPSTCALLLLGGAVAGFRFRRRWQSDAA